MYLSFVSPLSQNIMFVLLNLKESNNFSLSIKLFCAKRLVLMLAFNISDLHVQFMIKFGTAKSINTCHRLKISLTQHKL